jgi:hypothetical protein
LTVVVGKKDDEVVSALVVGMHRGLGSLDGLSQLGTYVIVGACTEESQKRRGWQTGKLWPLATKIPEIIFPTLIDEAEVRGSLDTSGVFMQSGRDVEVSAQVLHQAWRAAPLGYADFNFRSGEFIRSILKRLDSWDLTASVQEDELVSKVIGSQFLWFGITPIGGGTRVICQISYPDEFVSENLPLDFKQNHFWIFDLDKGDFRDRERNEVLAMLEGHGYELRIEGVGVTGCRWGEDFSQDELERKSQAVLEELEGLVGGIMLDKANLLETRRVAFRKKRRE